MALSRKDQMLMGGDDAPDNPMIQPNSQYDQSITFDEDSEPGQFSPRPDPNDPTPDFNSFNPIGIPAGNTNQLAGFELNLDQRPSNPMGDFGGVGGNQYGGGMGGNSMGGPPMFGNDNQYEFGMNPGFGSQNQYNDYSPRPKAPDPTGNMSSSPELAQLFSLISKFQPPPLEISPHFKPFLPDLVPSIGAIDAFIKVPRPDGEQDPLGLTVLDEPTIGCSNPQILKMQLREKFGVVGGNEGDGYIGFIEDPNKNEKALASFLESYDEISRNRAAPTISYTYKMPDMEELMEIWPEEMEKALDTVPLPTADLDLSLEEYARVICAILDIPVKNNIVESLHVLFSLYQQFKENQYFITNSNSRGSTPNPIPS